MLIQQVLLEVRPGQERAFESALLDVRQRVFANPGFRRFDVLQDAEHENVYQVRVAWESAEELHSFTTSDRSGRAWAPVQPFLERAPRISVLVERPTLDFQGPGVLDDIGLTHLTSGHEPGRSS